MKEIIDKYDQPEAKGFYLREVAKEIQDTKDKKEKFKEGSDEEMEYVSLSFAENYPKDNFESWGTYYGPTYYESFGDGTYREFPSIQQLNENYIEYWHQRAESTRNPTIKSRFLGLIFDFTFHLMKSKPEYKIANLYVESLIEFVKGDYAKHKRENTTALVRALEVATSFGQREVVKEIFQLIVKFEVENPSYYGFAFDYILPHKWNEEESSVIDALSKRFHEEVAKAIDEKYPWHVERVGLRLAKYFRRKQNKEEYEKIIHTIGGVFLELSSNVDGMQGSIWLEHLHKLYLDFNMGNQDHDIVVALRETQKKIELTSVSRVEEIEKTKVEEFVKSVVIPDPLETVINIANAFIPNKKKILEGIVEQANDPLNRIFTLKNIDNEGRTTGVLGNVEDDEEGHVIRSVMDYMPISSLYLDKALFEGFNKGILSVEEIMKLLSQSPIIDEDRLDIIKQGLNAFESADHLQFMHLVIPQIEDAIRNIVEKLGGVILKRTRSGSYHLRTFDEILREEKVVSLIGIDASLYLRMIYTDQRGLNLRNDMCHGNLHYTVFNQGMANRVLHTVFILCLIKPMKKADNK